MFVAGIFGKLADLELFVTEAEERKVWENKIIKNENQSIKLKQKINYFTNIKTKQDFLIGLKISETMKEFVKGEVREARVRFFTKYSKLMFYQYCLFFFSKFEIV